ncbi:hypothetical protein QEH52_11695 [Coraliomargarita sp. SDUM461003]|uniref:Lipocalin-like domain-containing protein n=1 Tax=Thalassobacterium maritimum TaxID=3041265 RepID=A0ABU1AVR4_9BACT|nr:hypothetical protein [Coraliomargarita sp. SDUM461003]MDQ8208176.1 hypothetical protein [Coraliomargarita sp. SDUM461003]
MDWFVDNSDHNNMDTVWSRPVRPEDGLRYSWAEEPVYDDQLSNLTTIVFDGYYNDLIIFTLSEQHGLDLKEKEFKFNLNEDGSPTLVSFKGMVLKIIEVDNLGLTYEWVKLG